MLPRLDSEAKREMRPIRRSDLANHVMTVAVIVLTVSAMLLPWHHHSITHDSSITDISLFLVEWKNETNGLTIIHSYSDDSLQSPLHNLMALTLSLVGAGLIASVVMAYCSISRFKEYTLVAGAASIACLSVAVILFYLLVGDSFESSRMMMATDPSFSGENIRFGWHGEGEYHMVWGPQIGFWLVIASTAILCLSVFFAARRSRV